MWLKTLHDVTIKLTLSHLLWASPHEAGTDDKYIYPAHPDIDGISEVIACCISRHFPHNPQITCRNAALNCGMRHAYMTQLVPLLKRGRADATNSIMSHGVFSEELCAALNSNKTTAGKWHTTKIATSMKHVLIIHKFCLVKK